MIFNSDHAQPIFQGGLFEIYSYIACGLRVPVENGGGAEEERKQELRDASHKSTPLVVGKMSLLSKVPGRNRRHSGFRGHTFNGMYSRSMGRRLINLWSSRVRSRDVHGNH